MIPRILTAAVGGCILGVTIFVTFGWAFAKGCPIFDPILDRDTTQPFYLLGFTPRHHTVTGVSS